MYYGLVKSSWFSRVHSNKLLPMTSRSVREFEDNLPSKPSLVASKSINRGSLKTRLDFLIQCVNLSVGLGNIWRFPHLAYENKGINFLIPYSVLVVFTGNPLFFLEVGIGQYAGVGPMILGKMVPLGKGLAAAMSYVSLLTMIYYGALMSHCMTYILISFYSELPWTHCTAAWGATSTCWERTAINSTDTTGHELMMPAEDFYSTYVLRLDKNILHKGLGNINEHLLVYLGITWFLIFIGLMKGQGKGLKGVMYIATIAPFLMLLALVLVAVRQQGAEIGINVLFNPMKFEIVPDLHAWRRAAEQMFYSLDVSTGNLIMYGACCEFRSSSLKDVLVVTTLDLVVSVASGTIVFSILGALSYETNIDFYFISKTGAGLAFIGFSEVIIRMPLPRLWNFVIFSCLYFVCLETQFCCLDPVFSTLFGFFPKLKSKKTLTSGILCFALFLLGIPCITQSGIHVIQIMDDIGAAMGLVFIGLLEAIFVTGIYGVHRFSEDMHFMLGSKPNIIWKILWVICPIFLGMIMLQCIVEWSVPSFNHIALPLYAVVLGWLSCLAAVVIVFGVAIYQAIVYYMRGELRNLLLPTRHWCPDNVALAKARSLFGVFSSTEVMRGKWKSTRHGVASTRETGSFVEELSTESELSDWQGPTTRSNASTMSISSSTGTTNSIHEDRSNVSDTAKR